MNAFYHILGNTLVASITNFTVWFALTFWIFLETKSVFATGMLAGIYLVLTAGTGFWFGSFVDHSRKKRVMLASSVLSFILYGLAFLLYRSFPESAFMDVSSVALWTFVLLLMIGVVLGNLRTIALPTLVTLLIPEDRRDRANGLVGMTTGIGFLVTSMISGFLVAWGGIIAALAFALSFTALAFLHLLFVQIHEPHGSEHPDAPKEPRRIDINGTLKVIFAVPGLMALILFATFNNFLGGIFMALMDAYGLSLVSVQTWGILLSVLSIAFIASGMVIAKTGLGKNPLRTLMLVNVIAWTTCIFFTIQPSIVLLAIGFFVWMFISPYAEAAEHTTLQKVVPFERQGRVFGFAQSVEQAASPLTAFLIGPLAQFFFIPFMTTGAGAAAIGSWFGTGPDRGIALVFIVAGALGLLMTIVAFNSKYYRQLSARYLASPAQPEALT
ncbi:MAG TPA: MFS transporter [Candidatus Paceibacterota bacterium]